MLSRRIINTAFFILVTIYASGVFAQDQNPERKSETDTTSVSAWPNIIRSAVVPGWGQVVQERPGVGMVFYGLTVNFLYNSLYNYYWYDRTSDSKYKRRAYAYTMLTAQSYIFNVADVAVFQLTKNPREWKTDRFDDRPLKSPWGAVARSAMLPGWGQVYNEQYLKSGILFAVFGNFAYKVYLNDQRYKKNKNPAHLEQRRVNSWYLGLTYLLTMVDAMVDAYLFEFDKTMELTYVPAIDSRVAMLHVQIHF